jgi:hypothetical protein
MKTSNMKEIYSFECLILIINDRISSSVFLEYELL